MLPNKNKNRALRRLSFYNRIEMNCSFHFFYTYLPDQIQKFIPFIPYFLSARHMVRRNRILSHFVYHLRRQSVPPLQAATKNAGITTGGIK